MYNYYNFRAKVYPSAQLQILVVRPHFPQGILSVPKDSTIDRIVNLYDEHDKEMHTLIKSHNLQVYTSLSPWFSSQY